MKLNSKLLILPFILLVLGSCKKDEHKVFFEEGTPPVLTASRTGTIPLSFATNDQEAVKLSWTNPDYMFTTGVSSRMSLQLVHPSHKEYRVRIRS